MARARKQQAGRRKQGKGTEAAAGAPAGRPAPLPEAEPAELVYPASREELAALLRTHFGIAVPRAALIPGHSAPLDYLWHAFNEDEPGPRDCVVWASRGGGKTFLAAVATMLDLVFKPGVQVRLLGGSAEQSRRMLAHLRRLFDAPIVAGMVEGKMSESRVRLINGSSAEILAASQTSVRGVRVQKIRCDEVDLFDRELWMAAQLATRSMTVRVPGRGDVLVKGTVEAISTMHIPGGLMWELVETAKTGDPELHGAEPIRRVFKWGVVDALERCGDEHACFAPEKDGPECPLMGECGGAAKKRAQGDAGGHITVHDAITLRRRVDLTTWKTEMLCLSPRRTDAVYPEFDQKKHVVGEPGAGLEFRLEHVKELMERTPGLDSVRVIAGMDFGFRSPTAAVLAVVVGVGDRAVVTVLDEHIATEKRLDENVAAMLERGWPLSERHDVPLSFLAVDPAGLAEQEQTGLSNVTLLKRRGLPVRHKRHRVHDGLQRVRALLDPADGGAGAGPRLRVHRRCRGLIEAMTKYRYQKVSGGSNDPYADWRPVKDGPDHVCDALRYMVVELWAETRPMGVVTYARMG